MPAQIYAEVVFNEPRNRSRHPGRLGLLLVAFVLEGGNPASLILPSPLIIIFGGTFGALLTGFDLSDVLSIPKLIGDAMRMPPTKEKDLALRFVALAEKSRRDGLLSLEEDMQSLDTKEDPLLKKGLRYVIDGTDSEALRELLENDVAIFEKHRKHQALIFESRGRLLADDGHHRHRPRPHNRPFQSIRARQARLRTSPSPSSRPSSESRWPTSSGCPWPLKLNLVLSKEKNTKEIFKEIHNLGNWVVNYDELLDRRQLLNQNVKVIRYKQCSTHGRNILISSTAPLSLLRSMVLGRIRDLNLELTDADCRKLTERFINDANEISGDIVLRAAKRGRNASELIGVVLSRYMIRHEIGTTRRFGWYFLDDYAEWLGQREEQIADILALSPEETADGQLQLTVTIAEAKYIDAANRRPSEKNRRSNCGIRSAASMMPCSGIPNDSIGSSGFPDSDLMLNGIQFPASSPLDLAAWRRAVREGQCRIHLRGYSHIFVSGPSDAEECSEMVTVAEAANS